MKAFTIAAILNFSLLVTAVPPFDPAGAKNVGNGAGIQFIGGQCLSDADCQSACCANPTGICSGPGASTQNGKTGCGFDSTGGTVAGSASVAAAAATAAATPNAAASDGSIGLAAAALAQSAVNAAGDGTLVTATSAAAAKAATGTSAAATSPAHGGPAFDPAGAKNVGNGAGQQFIGGQCLSGADCQSTCCAGPSGICSGLGAQTQAGKTGCGFVSGSASNSGAAAVGSSSSAAAVAQSTTAASSASKGGPAFDPAGAKNVGNGKGTQFIGGQCLSGADCQSTCCAGPSGICSGLGAQTQAGKTGCGFVSKKKLLRV